MKKKPELREHIGQLGRTVQIDTDRPIPLTKGLPYSLPFEKMEVGHSFFLPVYAGGSQAIMQKVRDSAGRFRRNIDSTLHITMRQEAGGIRVWRITEPAHYKSARERGLKGTAIQWGKKDRH